MSIYGASLINSMAILKLSDQGLHKNVRSSPFDNLKVVIIALLWLEMAYMPLNQPWTNIIDILMRIYGASLINSMAILKLNDW